MNKATCILIHTTYLNYSLLQCDNELLGACMSSTCLMFLHTVEWFLITRIKCMINIFFWCRNLRACFLFDLDSLLRKWHLWMWRMYLQRRIYRKPLRAMQGKLKDFLQHHDEPLWKYLCSLIISYLHWTEFTELSCNLWNSVQLCWMRWI